MSASHFDAIAAEYDASLPAHVVEHYLRKRAAYLLELVPGGRGLEQSCCRHGNPLRKHDIPRATLATEK